MPISKTLPKPKMINQPDKYQRDKAVERFCRDYLNDQLGPAQRKFLEARISKGDAEIINMLKKLQGEDASFKKVKTHNQRFVEDMRSLGVEMDPQNEPLLNKVETETNPKQNSEKVSKKQKNRIKQAFTRIIKHPKTLGSLLFASIFMILMVVIIYLQFERTRLNTKFQQSQLKLEQLSAETYDARNAARDASASYAWFLDLLRQPSLVTKSFANEKYLEGGKIFYDANTLKLAVIPGQVTIPEGQVISLWSEGTAEKRLVGILDPIKADSLYNQWNTPALIMINGLNIRISPKSENAVSYESTRNLARVDIP